MEALEQPKRAIWTSKLRDGFAGRRPRAPDSTLIMATSLPVKLRSTVFLGSETTSALATEK